jgi:hypothetical protein
MRDGRVSMFGPRTEVIDRLKRQRVQPIPPQPVPSQQVTSQPVRISQSDSAE